MNFLNAAPMLVYATYFIALNDDDDDDDFISMAANWLD